MLLQLNMRNNTERFGEKSYISNISNGHKDELLDELLTSFPHTVASKEKSKKLFSSAHCLFIFVVENCFLTHFTARLSSNAGRNVIELCFFLSYYFSLLFERAVWFFNIASAGSSSLYSVIHYRPPCGLLSKTCKFNAAPLAGRGVLPIHPVHQGRHAPPSCRY